MAIQMRRGNEEDLDISQLKAGECAICLDTGKMIVKLTGENYLTLTDTPELQRIVDSKAGSEHEHDDRYYTEDEIDRLLALMPQGGSGTVLYDSDGDNTSETITLSDYVSNYDEIEIFFGVGLASGGGSASSVKVVSSERKYITIFLSFANAINITFYNGLLALQNDTLLRGTAMDTAMGTTTTTYERITKINYGTSGTLTFTGTQYPTTGGYALSIYRVIGYKD